MIKMLKCWASFTCYQSLTKIDQVVFLTEQFRFGYHLKPIQKCIFFVTKICGFCLKKERISRKNETKTFSHVLPHIQSYIWCFKPPKICPVAEAKSLSQPYSPLTFASERKKTRAKANAKKQKNTVPEIKWVWSIQPSLSSSFSLKRSYVKCSRVKMRVS